MPFKDIRDWLIDGGHKMHKITEDKIEKLELWLARNKLPKYNDKENSTAQITINLAAELVRIFWSKSTIQEYKEKIMPLYPEKKWFLMKTSI